MFGAGDFCASDESNRGNRNDEAESPDGRRRRPDGNHQTEDHSGEQAAQVRCVERAGMDPVRQKSQDDKECEQNDDGPAPHDRGRWHALQAIRAPERTDQTEGNAAGAVSIGVGRKRDQLRHAAGDSCEEPKEKITGALKNRFGDKSEEQQETQVGNQMIQIDVHENGGEQAPPLSGEDGFAFHADGEQYGIRGVFGDGMICKNLQQVCGNEQ